MPSRIGNPMAKPNTLLRLAAGRQWPDTMKLLDSAGLELLLSNCSDEIKAIEPPKQPRKKKAYYLNGLA
jgi:hypothetical protein